MTFAINRKEMNKGTAGGSGRWIFEEFMYSDCIFGSAVVTYQVQAVRKDGPVDGLFGYNERWTVSLYDIEVAEVVVQDDNGNVVATTLDETEKLKTIVLEAFEDVLDSVLEYERSLI